MLSTSLNKTFPSFFLGMHSRQTSTTGFTVVSYQCFERKLYIAFHGPTFTVFLRAGASLFCLFRLASRLPPITYTTYCMSRADVYEQGSQIEWKCQMTPHKQIIMEDVLGMFFLSATPVEQVNKLWPPPRESF